VPPSPPSCTAAARRSTDAWSEWSSTTPVVDASVEGCAPAPDVAVTLYWTGALKATAQPGWDCAEGDWTCEGGTTIGIDAFTEALGTEVRDSPFDDHQWYVDAPETMAW
jgi:hypothetical protein